MTNTGEQDVEYHLAKHLIRKQGLNKVVEVFEKLEKRANDDEKEIDRLAIRISNLEAALDRKTKGDGNKA